MKQEENIYKELFNDIEDEELSNFLKSKMSLPDNSYSLGGIFFTMLATVKDYSIKMLTYCTERFFK